MRLLHVTATHLSLVGGIPVVLRDLVTEQNKIEGFTARVLSIKACVNNMESDYFDLLGTQSFSEYLQNYMPDIVIFHSHYYFEYIALYKELVRRTIPYYIEPHGSFGSAALNKSKWKKKIANNLLLYRFMKNAKGFIFLNKSEKEDSRFRTSNDIIIPNGISGEVASYLKKDRKVKFYFIGRFDIEHKGLDILFDALRLLEEKKLDYVVDFYGSGTDEQECYINNKINEFSCLQVKNKGPIYGKTKETELEQCGIMLLTSRYEGFPMTSLEAWKYGNPCIVTKGTNIQDEVVENHLGWATSLNATEIANVIVKAANEYKEQSEKYINGCKQYVVSNYKWAYIAEQSYQILKQKIER